MQTITASRVGAEMARSPTSLVMGAGVALASILFMSALLGGLAQSSSTTRVPAIITFGDSTVDVGNNNHIPTTFRADFSRYGRDFSKHESTGRFCNGKLVTDFIAEALGFTTLPAAYLSPQASGKNLLIGVNFASAASGYYDKTALSYNAIPFSEQLMFYMSYQSKLAKVAGNRSNASTILSEALYLVSAGSSDYIQNYYINPNLNKTYSPDEFSSILVDSFSNSVKGLYSLGARRIGVTSLPPLGCMPAAITLYGQGHNGCVSRLNADAKDFNKKLNGTVSSLLNQFPMLKLVVLDIYTPLFDLANAPSKYGFSEGRMGCCVTGTVNNTSLLCNTKSTGTCSNAAGYVFWDGVHPSQSANQVISDSLINQVTALIY